MSDEEGRDPNRWRVLAVTQLAGFMGLLDVSIVTVALPSLQRGLGASEATVQWVVSGYALTFGLATVFYALVPGYPTAITAALLTAVAFIALALVVAVLELRARRARERASDAHTSRSRQARTALGSSMSAPRGAVVAGWR